MLRTLLKNRELIEELTKREIKSRYKQSVLGYAWVILNPFFQMLVMAFVFSHIVRIPNLSVPYPIFIYVGLLPWTLFSQAVTSSMNALVYNSVLIKKVYFPREILILSAIAAKMVDFFLATTVFLLFLIYYRMPFTVSMLWFIPIFFIQQLFTYGLSLILAACNLFYRDIQYIVALVLTLWMYLTPIIYSTETFPERYRFVFQLNPMAVLVNAYRQVLLGGGAPNFVSLGIAFLISVLLILFGYRFFKKLEGVFADVV
jgi:lipopolysaccharide transport system permease protein